jgi:cell division septation protein DedD|tara:strand:- start:932 stop:1342 length:411 start_codon:yes stop_codon:yes gene_type:complete
MTIKRILGLFFPIALITLLTIIYYPKTTEITSIEVNKESISSNQNSNGDFEEFNESDFDFFVYRAHVLSSKDNADKLKEKIVDNGFPAFVESFGDKGNLHAIYVGPFLSEDDIVTNMDLIRSISESNNGEVSRWKL